MPELALVGYGKMGKLIEQLAGEYGFQVRLKLDEYNNANFEGLTAENFRGVDVAVDCNYTGFRLKAPQKTPDDFSSYEDYVSYTAEDSGNWEVYTVPLGGGAVRNLSNNPSQDGLPAVSPDGQSVAFVSDRSGQWAVWAMRLDGSGQHMLFPLENGYANGGDLDWTSERISWAP